MGQGEGLADLDDLPGALLGAEVDGCADRSRAHLMGLFHGAEQDLVELVRVSQQLIVVHLHQERNLVRVLAGDGAQHPECRRDRITATLERETHDVLRVEIIRVPRKARARGVLDALIDR